MRAVAAEYEALAQIKQTDAQKFAAQLSVVQQATAAETDAKITAVAQMVAAQHQNEIAQLKLQLQERDAEKSSLLTQVAALKTKNMRLTELLQEQEDRFAHVQARSSSPGRLEPGGKSVGAAKMAEQLLLLRKLQENMLEMQTEMGGDIADMHGAMHLMLAASTSSPL